MTSVPAKRRRTKTSWLGWLVAILVAAGAAVGLAYFLADRADKSLSRRIETAKLDELMRLSEKEDFKRDPMLFYWLGVRLEEANRPKDAVLALARSVSLDRKNVKAHYALGVALERVDRPAEAEDQLKAAIALDPKASAPEFVLGKLYGRYRRWQEAVDHLKRAVELSPNDIEAAFLLGVSYSELARRTHGPFREQARETLEKASQLAPKDTRILRSLAALYVFFNQVPQAEKVYRRILELEPNDLTIRALLGRTLAEQKSPETLAEAEKLLLECASKDAENPGVPMGLGVLYANRQEPQKAIPYLNRAIEMGVKEPEVWFHLGRSYTAVGKTEEGKKATALFTQKDLTRRNIRIYEMKLGFVSEENPDQAKEVTELRFKLAKELIADERYSSALGYLKLVIKRDAANAEAQKLLALCEEKGRESPSAPSPTP